jgi:formylglycine-generating enzyme required for sulfatase activity
MVKISAKGYNFEMGQSDIKALGVDANGYMNAEFELPPHNVTFARDFWMDTTEVTQGEFDRLMKKYYPTYATPKWDATHGIGDNYPVYFESWTNAALFCNARSKEDSLDTVYGYASISGTVGTETVVLKSISVNTSAKGYRLPTEAEWEYAYRGGKTTDFFWSKNLEDYKTATAFADVDSHAVWKKVSFDKGAGNPGYGVRVVASTSPNNYGLYDIAGNTSEWYHDSFDSYTWDAVTDSVKKVTSSETSKHSLRGGNWASDVNSLRAAVRYFDSGSDYYQFLWGFRTARTSED